MMTSILNRVKSVLLDPTTWLRILAVFAFTQFILFFTARISTSSTAPKDGYFEEYDATNDFMNVCRLPKYDFWHPNVMKFVDGNSDPLKTCNRTFAPYTELVNGEWRIVEKRKGLECKARCARGISDWETRIGEWMAPGKVDCEFLEAVCWQDGVEVYGYIHTQIIPKKTFKEAKSPQVPNVIVFLIDSMDTGRAKRSLPKTLALLNQKFDSVEFPFVNKVGENSFPNGHALWLGEQIEPIDRSMFGGERIAPDRNFTVACRTYVEPHESIFHEFQKHGYVTLDIDDWRRQMMTYPKCKGFRELPTDHYMHAFHDVAEKMGTRATKRHLNGRLCREKHHAAFDYFQQFVDAYPTRPKFAWTWLNSLGHNSFNGLMRLDKQMVELIEHNADLVDNSFFVLMGDHGFRMGNIEYQQSAIGRMEVSNPYLSISIPKSLRSDPSIREMMRANAKRLQTHYDTRATLLDIANFQPQKAFRDRRLRKMSGEKGHSYLRKQPSTIRTCGTLPIPLNYCICQVKKTAEVNETMKWEFGERMIEQIHAQLEMAGHLASCERFRLREVTGLLHYGIPHNKSKAETFELSVMAEAPSYAHFTTVVIRKKKTGELHFEKINRMDVYGDSGNCIQSREFESMCYCKGRHQKWTTRIRNHLWELKQRFVRFISG